MFSFGLRNGIINNIEIKVYKVYSFVYFSFKYVYRILGKHAKD